VRLDRRGQNRSLFPALLSWRISGRSVTSAVRWGRRAPPFRRSGVSWLDHALTLVAGFSPTKVFILFGVKTFVSGRPYWWQWFTILSLDATAVAVSWQALFGRVAGVSLHPVHRWVLASSVWCAYTADRWIEGWRLSPERTLTQRHYYSVRWRWPIFFLWWLVLAADLGVALLSLNRREFSAGLLLLGPVLLYLFSHQFFHRRHPWRLPKEICVAALMCGGVTVFLLAQPNVALTPLLTLSGGFAFLCLANTALISVWEREVDESQDQDSLAKRSQRAARVAHILPWAGAVAALVWALGLSNEWSQRGFLCVTVSSALLGLVDLFESRIGRQLARVLSDAVLLTPLIALVRIGA